MDDVRKCIKCGSIINANSKFCTKCGAPLAPINNAYNNQNNAQVYNNVQPYNVPNTQNQYNRQAPSKPKEKVLTAPLIILIICGILVVITTTVVLLLTSGHKSSINIDNPEITIVDNKTITIPNVIGCTKEEAERLLSVSNIKKFYFEEIETSDYVEGTIFSVSPQVGEIYNPNTEVVLRIARSKSLEPVVYINELIKMRSTPTTSTDSNYLGKVNKGQKFIVYEETFNDGYTWYRIGNNKWIATKDDWTSLSENSSDYDEIKSAMCMIKFSDYQKEYPTYSSINGATTSKKINRYEIHYAYEISDSGSSKWYRIENGRWVKDNAGFISIVAD